MRYEDEVKGKARQVKGSVKENLGKAIGNPDLQDRGNEERFSGKVQEKTGKVKRKIGEAVEDLGDKIAG
jgi:uncharacterized protein YjbJ (UPF0337 family)